MAPDVSVLIPVFKTAGAVSRSIQSMLAQTSPDWEIIAVNDASPDNAAEILSQWSGKDRRIRVITHAQNQGTLTSRMDAAAAANGEYILCLDADDTFEPETVAETIKLARRHQADVVGFGAKLLHDDPKRDRYADTVDVYHTELADKHIFEAMFCDHAYNWSVCLKLIRRDIFMRAVKLIRPFYCVSAEDFLLYTIIAYFAKKLVFSGKIFYRYYIDEGITAKEYDLAAFQRFCTMFDALKSVRAFLETQGEWTNYQSAFQKREQENLQYLFHRWPHRIKAEDRTASLEYMLQQYDRKVLEEYLQENFSAEFIGQALSAVQNKKEFPPLPVLQERQKSYARRCFDQLRFLLPTGSAQWHFLKRLHDQKIWRKYK